MAAILNFRFFSKKRIRHLKDIYQMSILTKIHSSNHQTEASRKSLKLKDVTEEIIQQKTFVRPHPPT